MLNHHLSTIKDDQAVPENVIALQGSSLAEILQAGMHLSAFRQVDASGKVQDKFAKADFLFVKIQLPALGIDVVLNAPFTKRYACVTAVNGSEAILGFKTPKTIDDAKTYVRLLAGLETIYAGALRHSSATHAFGLKGQIKTSSLDQRLSIDAYHRLDKLGAETKQIRKNAGGYVRSHVTVDRSTVIRLATGEEVSLEQLPKDMHVFCPVHVDMRPMAIVHWYGDGTPGIQCSQCKRTYTAQNTNRVYDFNEFDEVIKSLASMSKTEPYSGILDISDPSIVYLNQPYLSEINLAQGVTIVKSPKGTGKTEALVKLITTCKKQKLRVLLIGHRRALIQAMANRLGIDAYFITEAKSASKATNPLASFFDDENAPLPKTIELDEDTSTDDLAPYIRVAPTKQYAISLDSLTELKPEENKYEVVIIDESEQVFSHLIGGTLKQRRRGVYARLSHYLKVAQHVVVMDADMNRITIEALLATCRDDTLVNVLINEPKSTNGVVLMYQNKGQLTNNIVEHVIENKKIYVATNSKKKAEELLNVLQKRCPEKRMVLITSDNSQHESTQKVLADITHEYKTTLDVLIASPAIGTGIDITFKDADGKPVTVVDSVFGLFEGNIITHFDIDQQLMRVRHPESVHVWIDQRPLNYEVDTDCIKRELDQTVRQTAYLVKYSDDGKPIYSGDEGLLEIYARVLASQRGSKNSLATLFRELREQNGWQINDVEFNDYEENAGKEALVAAREQRLVEREINLISAARLDKNEANLLADKHKKGIALTHAERYALERHQIETFYAQGDISAEMIAFDNEARTRPLIQRLECLICDAAWFQDMDDKELKDNVVAFDRGSYLVQRQILEKLFTATGLFDPNTRQFDTDAKVDISSLSTFITVLDDNCKQFEFIFGKPVNVDRHKNPIAQLNAALLLIGLIVVAGKVSQKNGKKIRYYGIEVSSYSDMLRVVKSRDKKFAR